MKTRLIAVLVVVAGLVAACSSGEGSGGQLDGTKWILRSYLVDSTLTLVPDTEYADAEFDAQPGLRVRRLQPLRRPVSRREAGRCSSRTRPAR